MMPCSPVEFNWQHPNGMWHHIPIEIKENLMDGTRNMHGEGET